MHDSIKVRKNGVEKEVRINHEENKFHSNKIVVMVSKTKCFDMFQHTKVDGMVMYEEQTLKQTLDYKYGRNSR